MNGYLLGVIGTVLLCSLLTAIAPEGKTSAAIKGIAKLACALAILAPVLRFFQSGDIDVLLGAGEKNSSQTVIRTDEAFIQYYSERRVEETEAALETELLEKYAVAVEVDLTWRFDEESLGGKYSLEKIKIERIHIQTVEQTTEEVKHQMQTFVAKTYCSEVQIE